MSINGILPIKPIKKAHTEKPKKQKTKNTRSEIIREQTVDEEALLCVRDNTHRQATEWYVYWL